MPAHQQSFPEQTMKELLKQAHAPGLTHRFDQIAVENSHLSCEEVIQKLDSFLTDARKNRIANVIANRTFHVAPVIEGLANTGNVSAVMRTAEGLGFQPFHIINNGQKFKHSERISHGAEKWLSLWRWNDSLSCSKFLKKQGYRLVVSTVNDMAIPITDLDFTQPTAIAWGNEAEGVSSTLLDEADQWCYIPMSGFTESLNISVAAAVSLFHIYEKRMKGDDVKRPLKAKQETYLQALFYYRSVKHSNKVLLKKN